MWLQGLLELLKILDVFFSNLYLFVQPNAEEKYELLHVLEFTR